MTHKCDSELLQFLTDRNVKKSYVMLKLFSWTQGDSFGHFRRFLPKLGLIRGFVFITQSRLARLTLTPYYFDVSAMDKFPAAVSSRQ